MIELLFSSDLSVTVGIRACGSQQPHPLGRRSAHRDRERLLHRGEVVIFGGRLYRTDWVTTCPLHIVFSDPLTRKDNLPFAKGPCRIGHDACIRCRVRNLAGEHRWRRCGYRGRGGRHAQREALRHRWRQTRPNHLVAFPGSRHHAALPHPVVGLAGEKARAALPLLCPDQMNDFLRFALQSSAQSP